MKVLFKIQKENSEKRKRNKCEEKSSKLKSNSRDENIAIWGNLILSVFQVLMIKKKKWIKYSPGPQETSSLVRWIKLLSPTFVIKTVKKSPGYVGSKKKKMARASQRGPQRLVVNAEQVLYRQRERVRTIQVLGTVWTNESAQSRRLRGRGGLPGDVSEGVSQVGLWSPCEVACLILRMTGNLRRVKQGNNMIKWAF